MSGIRYQVSDIKYQIASMSYLMSDIDNNNLSTRYHVSKFIPDI